MLEDEGAEAVDQDTSQPETVAAQGETGVVKEPREVGFSYSHLDPTSTLVNISCEEGSTRH